MKNECPKCGGDKKLGEPICHFCAENVLRSFKNFVSALDADEVKVLEKALGIDLGLYCITDEDVFDYAAAMRPELFHRDLRKALTTGGTMLDVIIDWREDYKQEIREWLTS